MNLLENFVEKSINYILKNPYGTITENIYINGRLHEITFSWKRKINIKIKSSQYLLEGIDVCEIQKMPFLSFISRSPNYYIRGKRTNLTEKLLSNKYTPALLRFPSSKLCCENNQISYIAKLRKTRAIELDKIIKYFEALSISIS